MANIIVCPFESAAHSNDFKISHGQTRVMKLVIPSMVLNSLEPYRVHRCSLCGQLISDSFPPREFSFRGKAAGNEEVACLR